MPRFSGALPSIRCSHPDWVLALLVLIPLGACDSGSKPERDWANESREVLRSRSSGAAGTAGDWSIVVDSFAGPDARQQAERRAGVVAEALRRPDVAVRESPRGAAVVVGAYANPTDRAAQADLDRLRAFEVRGVRPFERAFLAPPPERVDPGLVPELNLAEARKTFGRRAAYTLQVAVYESPRRDDAKRAAEQAAVQLRREGELAFYHHGPSRSSVTVGVFSDADFDETLRPKNPAMIALQQRYPLNLLNGQFPIIERQGDDQRQQPSMLVRIP